MGDYLRSRASSGVRPRILVVEDEALIAITMQDYLKELGCECIGPFFAMETALPIARIEILDAALLDVRIGGDESYELAEILASRGIPFGFATGFLHLGLP